ncbi:hypothetical protein Mapa_002915 [Marchantia paleacea]|nr:hypothetical protein Mapa_002915 [Marchantia paleacea]
MDIFFGRDPLSSALTHILNSPEEYERSLNPSTRTYVRDTKAMFSTCVDVKELPNAYIFVADMPGLKSGDIKVQVENDNVLTIGGERKRDESKEEAKFLRMERPAGKFLRKFTLPGNSKVDDIQAACTDGVLTITVPKIPPPEPHKPKTIEVTVG